LGYEYGELHSFICNGLEREYAVLGIQLNRCGLLDGLTDAERAAEFTNLESTGAEPVPWDAWRIDEYDANEVAASPADAAGGLRPPLIGMALCSADPRETLTS
jgi:hypothetical protein